jgi:hypothetical protein
LWQAANGVGSIVIVPESQVKTMTIGEKMSAAGVADLVSASKPFNYCPE